MSISRNMMMAAAGNAGGAGGLLAIEDVFSTYLYTGNGSTQAIKNGIALADGPDGTLGTSTRFNGTNDSLNKSSDLTGNSDGKTFTFSFWVNPVYGTTSDKTIYHTSGSWRNQIRYSSNGALFVSLFNNESSGGTVFEIQNPNIKLTFGGWNHVLISADLTDTNKRHLYINDVEATPSWSYVNNTVDFTRSTHAIGDDLTASTGNLHGDLAHFFLDYTYRDLSVTANRRTFIDSARGSTPSSTLSSLNPILYLPMTGEYSIGDNIGTGGDFNTVGSPTIVDNGTGAVEGVGQGGLVWAKNRTSAVQHALFDTIRGQSKRLATNLTSAEVTMTPVAGVISSFNSDGFSLSVDAGTVLNDSGQNYASWTFRKAPRFFDVVTYTGDGTNGRQILHDLGHEVGCCIIKKTSASGDWWIYHRSAPANSFGILNGTNSFTTSSINSEFASEVFGDGNFFQAPTDTFIEVSSFASNESGTSYVAYLFAHDPLGPSGDGSDGLISCGSYTGNGSTNGPEINLGWEPQWLLIKNASSSANWELVDNMRDFRAPEPNVGLFALNPNLSDAEAEGRAYGATSTGFKIVDNHPDVNASGNNYIYIAIRRGPMRQPESGTEVFAAAYGDGTFYPAWDSGFPVDMAIDKNIGGGSTDDSSFSARLIQGKYLSTNKTDSEFSWSNYAFDYMDGYRDTNNGATDFAWMFRRAPGFFDVVTYTGNGVAGRTVPHNLGVAPEMLIIKPRATTLNWQVYHSGLDASAPEDYRILLNTVNARLAHNGNWNQTQPESNVFTLGSQGDVNFNNYTYIANLFATLPGVSKVGSYTGNGTSQTIDCGFTSGARFILIKRTDSTGDWYVWDTERGIVAANDPHLSLNTTAAEVTTDDSVDPESSGFIVNQVSATNINVSSGEYIFLAIS